MWLKQSSRSLGQEFFAGGDDQEYFAGGDGHYVKDDKPTEIYDNHYSKVDKRIEVFESRKARKVFEVTNVRTGGKSILETTDSKKTNPVLLPDQNNNRAQGKVSTTKYTQDEDDDGEGIYLYGLICAWNGTSERDN